MATSSLLKVNLEQVLEKAERLSGTKLPRQVVEASLDRKLNLLCIRFRKPISGELAEPLSPQVHAYRDRSNGKITAIEVLDADKL